MKKAIPLLLLLFFLGCGKSFADPPSEVGGFKLGANITAYKDSIVPDSALPLRHSEYLSEVDVKAPEGFKSGYLTYASCDQEGKILKVKLKYDRDDKQFFDELLEYFNKQFGKPNEYQGDAFRACIAWKWSFTGKENEQINTTLSHNCEEDEGEEGGNAVRMVLRSDIEKERACFKAKQAKAADNKDDKNKKKPDFKLLVPR